MSEVMFKVDEALKRHGVMDLPFGAKLRAELATEFHNARANAASEIIDFCRLNPTAYCQEVVRHFGKTPGAPR